jgi:hypothetical protein
MTTLDQEKAVIHVLPCSIDFDGEAKIDAYFQPTASGEAAQAAAS